MKMNLDKMIDYASEEVEEEMEEESQESSSEKEDNYFTPNSNCNEDDDGDY